MPMTTAQSQDRVVTDSVAVSTLAGLGAVVLFSYAFMGLGLSIAFTLAGSGVPAPRGLAILTLWIVGAFVGGLLCLRKFRDASHPSDPPASLVIVDDDRVVVDATIVKRRAKSLQNPRYLGGSDAAAQAAVAIGAYLILTGQWSMTIEYELDGQRYVDHDKVPSQVYYRYSNAETMPIRVHPALPTEWEPVLEPRQVSAAWLAQAPVTRRR